MEKQKKMSAKERREQERIEEERRQEEFKKTALINLFKILVEAQDLNIEYKIVQEDSSILVYMASERFRKVETDGSDLVFNIETGSEWELSLMSKAILDVKNKIEEERIKREKTLLAKEKAKKLLTKEELELLNLNLQ